MRENGRSMVEMLGVLAIIGVLSVGAMSGYSKAMMKYKLNKQTEQISYILNNMILEHEKLDRDYESIKNNGDTNGDMTSSFINLGLVLEEMIAQNNITLYDIFDNRVRIWEGEDIGRYFRLTINLEQQSMDTCLNLYTFAKANSADLWQTLFYKGTENGESGGYRVYGDKYCTANNTYLKDMTISEMEERCSFCKDGLNGCSFNIVYRLW